MPLDDLNKQLYRPDDVELAFRTHEKSEYDPFGNAGGNESPFKQEENWSEPQKGMKPSQKKKIWIAVGIFLAIVLAVGGTMFYRWWVKNAFHQDRVVVSLEGPKEVDSTQSVKYVINYANNNRVTLKNAELQLTYPENFQPSDNVNLKYLSPTSSRITLADIKPGNQGSIEVKGAFYAPKDFPVFLNSQLHFTPSNGVVALVIENKVGVRITAAPVQLDVTGPKQVVNGDSLEYIIDYKNLDTRSINNVQVRVEFPQGFQLGSSTPKIPESESTWYVGNLDAGQGGKILIQGQMNGSNQEAKNIVATLGYLGDKDNFVVYDKRELSTRMVTPVLAVVQKLGNKEDKTVNAGEILRYDVQFQNTGDIGLRDAIISVEVKGKILDFSKIAVEKGFYDSSSGLITWKASDVPGLAIINPKAGGTVRFSIPVKNVIPTESKLDKNMIISSIAKIDSPDIPTPLDSNKIIGSNVLELKLASKVLFDVSGYYNDAKIKNSGPLPMESGQETTFTLHWTVVNISNDITEAKVTSSLPSNVRWTGQVFPLNEKVAYNPRTNQIVWDAGDIAAGSGAYLPARDVAFSVGVTPQTNQVGAAIDLINPSFFTAKDPFVNASISLEGKSRNTILYEDPLVGYSRGSVAK